ncbi:MAG TPA: BatA domain-containing protein, partial [Dongiaceae bacterium]
MLGLGSLSFISPWLLLGLAALPMLWWLLRLTPPTPRRVSFPAIRLLFDLVPQEETPYRTPLWLILMRLLLAALVILGFAGPLLNAHSELQGKRALMLVVDDGWAAAPGWPDREHSMGEAVDEAERYKIPVILLTTAPSPDGGAIVASGMLSAAEARQKIRVLEPHPWATDRTAALAAVQHLDLKPEIA